MAEFMRTRDRRRFEMLYDRHEARVLRHVRRFVRSEAQAEELTQEVFVRVYTAKRYTPDARFESWLYRIATNVCLNELRRPERRARIESLDAPEPEAPGSVGALPCAGGGPEANLLGKELARRLTGALDRLPPKQRAAFLMARQEAATHEEIAAALSTSVSAVKSLIHRALETLRKEAAAVASERAPQEVS